MTKKVRTGKFCDMSRRTEITIEDDWPEWKREVGEAILKSGRSMKEVSLAAGKGETFIRDMLKRYSAPSAENLMLVQRTLGINSGFGTPSNVPDDELNRKNRKKALQDSDFGDFDPALMRKAQKIARFVEKQQMADYAKREDFLEAVIGIYVILAKSED